VVAAYNLLRMAQLSLAAAGFKRPRGESATATAGAKSCRSSSERCWDRGQQAKLRIGSDQSAEQSVP